MIKTLKLYSLFVALFATIAFAGNSKIIWIEEPGKTLSSNKQLRKRIARLERAVTQLQRKVFELEFDKNSPETPEEKEETRHTCYIETPFNGLISETKTTLTEAKTAAVQACIKKTDSGLKCKMDNVKCGH